MNKLLALLKNLISVTGFFLLLTVLCLIWNIWISGRGDGAVPLIKNAVIITDGKVLPENEGRLVLVSGKVTAAGSTTTDPDFELTVESPYLRRKVGKYRYVSPTKDKNGDYVPGYHDWLEESNDSAIKKDGTIDPFLYDSQRDFPYQDKVFYSTAKIGEFELSLEHLHKFQNSLVLVHGLQQSVAEKLGMELLSDTTYFLPKEKGAIDKFFDKVSSKDTRSLTEGDVRVYFYMIDTAKIGDITILAKQEGGKLTDYAYGDIYSINELYNGIVSHGEILAEAESDASGNKIITGVVTGIFATITVILIIRKIRRKRR